MSAYRVCRLVIFSWIIISTNVLADFQSAYEAFDREDYSVAFLEFGLLAKQGDADAQAAYGLLHEFGNGTKKDASEAVRWYGKSARQGNQIGQFHLGRVYDLGVGLPENNTIAVRWYLKSANQGYAQAQFYLGTMYQNGEGVLEDQEEAIHWYRKAAKQGNADAQLQLGKAYAAGEKSIEDPKKSLYWTKKAAEQGNADAQYGVGIFYHGGYGAQKDISEAVRWYKKAAEQGYDKAQYSLGLIYEKGEGVPTDYEKAFLWYRKAAEQGHTEAQSNLAILYALGEGVSEDLVQAHVWSSLANNKELIELIEELMSPAQMANASRLLQDRKQSLQSSSYSDINASSELGWDMGTELREGIIQSCIEYSSESNKLQTFGDDFWKRYCICVVDQAHSVYPDKSSFMWDLLEKEGMSEKFIGLAMKCMAGTENENESVTDNALATKIKDMVNALNSLTPLTLDFATRLDKAEPLYESNNIILHHTITDPSFADIIKSSIKTKERIVQLISEEQCLNPLYKNLLGSDIHVTYTYNDSSNDHVFSFDLECSGITANDAIVENQAPALLTSIGTGFFVGDINVLTNHHVVEGCSTISINNSYYESPATIAKTDQIIDLALLKTRKKSDSIAEFRLGRGVRTGDDVIVAGYPLGKALGSGLKATTGNISSLSGLDGDVTEMQITAPIHGGNSGGPVLDRSGNVVGVVVSKLGKKAEEYFEESLQNINFAIKENMVLSFLDANDIRYNMKPSNEIMDAADIVDKAKKYVVQIQCVN